MARLRPYNWAYRHQLHWSTRKNGTESTEDRNNGPLDGKYTASDDGLKIAELMALDSLNGGSTLGHQGVIEVV
jgi:hypothetical protein